MSREQPKPASPDLHAAAVLLLRRTYGEVVRLLGHEDPITVRLWETIAAEAPAEEMTRRCRQQIRTSGRVSVWIC